MRLHAVRAVAEGWLRGLDDEGNEVRSVKKLRGDTKARDTTANYVLGFALALDVAADLEYVRGSRLQHLGQPAVR